MSVIVNVSVVALLSLGIGIVISLYPVLLSISIQLACANSPIKLANPSCSAVAPVIS